MADEFANKIDYIRNTLSRDNVDVFINVRTDAFLLAIPDATEKTKSESAYTKMPV